MSGRLLVLGRSGQLARALAEAAGRNERFEVVLAGRERADLAVPGTASALIDAVRPEFVINAAAYTAVDMAEIEPEAAFAINARAVGEAAESAARIGARFVHVSTDYVFTANGPHDETSPPEPVNVYGASKLEGERLVLAACPDAAVVRTAGVFSGRGADFPSAIWRLAGRPDPIRVVADQTVTPTPADELAERLLALVQVRDASGVFHCGGVPGGSWHYVADAALAVLAEAGGPRRSAEAVSSAAFSRPAPRPSDSQLCGNRLADATGLTAPDWRAGLERALDRWRQARR